MKFLKSHLLNYFNKIFLLNRSYLNEFHESTKFSIKSIIKSIFVKIQRINTDEKDL